MEGERVNAHIPALLDEVLTWMHPRVGGLYIDGTLGAGGHALAILEASAPDGRLLGFDRDPEALRVARKHLAQFGERYRLVHASFEEMARLAPEHVVRSPPVRYRGVVRRCRIRFTWLLCCQRW